MTERPLKAGNALQRESLKLRKSPPTEVISVSCELFLLSYSLDVVTMVPEEMINLLKMETSQEKKVFPSVQCSSPIFQAKF